MTTRGKNLLKLNKLKKRERNFINLSLQIFHCCIHSVQAAVGGRRLWDVRERERKNAKRRCFVGYLWRKLRIIMKNYALSSITLNWTSRKKLMFYVLIFEKISVVKDLSFIFQEMVINTQFKATTWIINWLHFVLI